MSRTAKRTVASTAAVIAAVSLLACAGAWARSSDRGQQMAIDAGATDGTLDDRQPTVLSQGVTIDQGSLHIESASATVSTRGGDPVRAVLTGSPVKLKQLLDDGTPMSATASRVDYDLVNEIVIFTGAVNIVQPRGSSSGERFTYNMKTGQVSGGGDGGRVKILINPRNKAAAPAKPAATKPAPAKPTPTKKPGAN
ncbi:lipopolysaccharide transport periplasmic protein LptA [Lysobacter fragariae]